MPTLALPDANVLHARTLRDWLLMLKDTSHGDMFRLAYTEDIVAETLYHIRRKNADLDGGVLADVREKIVAVMDVRIRDYPSGQDAIQIADPFDRHIHAAAMAGEVDCIVTSDHGFTKLPVEVRDQLEYEIYTPDEFFVLVDDSSPSLVRATAQRQIEYFGVNRKNPNYDLAGALIRSGCPDFADRVKRRCQELARS